MLGQRVRRARIRAGLTQRDLAKLVRGEYERSMISNIENGRTKMRIDALADVADALNVSADYLLGRTGNPRTLAGDDSHATAFPVEDRALAAALAVLATHYEQLNPYGRRTLLAELRHTFPTLLWSSPPATKQGGSRTGA